MKGLPNAGHTCYLNAALQCLLYCANMTNYFLAEGEVQDACKKKKLASALGLAYGELVRDYWRRAGTQADPTAVREAFVKACRGFAPQRQHDAHEAMVCLLDRLHDGLSRLKPGAAAVAACPGVRREAWGADLKGACSVVSEVFRGQVEQTVRAEEYASTTCDHFTSLSLAVKDATSLSQCLQRHMADETVADFRVADDRHVPATLTKRFTYLPRILVIHLKRFDSSGAKIDRFIDYPAELDMGEYTAPDCPRHYQLFAVCLHRGTETGGGHYAALGEVKGAWFEMDDDSARRMDDINNIIQRDAYVLLYRRL